MDIEGKDAAIGILLITVVGLSGGLGFIITVNPFGTQSTTTTQCPDEILLYGLSDDWTNAPNS